MKKDGERVVVTVDGKEVWSHSLSEDAVYTVKSPNGSNVVRIQDQKASVTEADCPDQICRKHKAIDKTGETLSACRIKSWWKLKTEPGRKNMTELQIKEKNQ